MSRALSEPFLKDPDSTEPIGFDWTSYLADFAGTVHIQSSTYLVTGPDSALTTSNASILGGNLTTQVFLVGGTVGRRYVLTNRIVTDSSPQITEDRSIEVLVQNQ